MGKDLKGKELGVEWYLPKKGWFIHCNQCVWRCGSNGMVDFRSC